MEWIKGDFVFLRSLEMADLEVLLRIENNKSFWCLSDTTGPFSKGVMRDYLLNAQDDIVKVKQYRFAICNAQTRHMIGLVDLFDYDKQHERAGVGILIEDIQHRNKGYAAETLSLLLHYAKQKLGLHQLYANILEDNENSIRLFEKQGFRKIGLKRNWRLIDSIFKNELLYQHIL